MCELANQQFKDEKLRKKCSDFASSIEAFNAAVCTFVDRPSSVRLAVNHKKPVLRLSCGGTRGMQHGI